jgi:hypothetical protein
VDHFLLFNCFNLIQPLFFLGEPIVLTHSRLLAQSVCLISGLLAAVAQVERVLLTLPAQHRCTAFSATNQFCTLLREIFRNQLE